MSWRLYKSYVKVCEIRLDISKSLGVVIMSAISFKAPLGFKVKHK